jgi:two-component system chemotaxis response regulator CheB
LPVREAQDKEPVVPGTVYFAPPDYHLLVDKGPLLMLSVDDPVHYARPSIDVLFESAEDIFGERLLGIILSGANEDGAAGLRAIHAAGGIAVVQQPQGAYATLMPEAALLSTPQAKVLTLTEIADLLRTLGSRAP